MSTATAARRTAPGELQCPKCNHPPFTNRKGLAMHNARVHDRTILVPREKRGRVSTEIQCDKCDKTFKNEHGLHVHQARAHNIRHAKSPKAMVNLLISTFADKPATNGHTSCSCTECHYDMQPLVGSEKPPTYCPGCATPIQAMVAKLETLAKGRVRL